MKLFKSGVLTSSMVVYGLERGLDPLQSIAFAHSRIRQGFLIPEMDNIIDQNERLLSEVFAPDFNTRLISLEEMVSRSENITSSFIKQGSCHSSFPTYDGSCNHPNDKGRSMQEYERLVAAEYCDNQQAPRCASSGGELPPERKVSLALGNTKQSQTASAQASVLFTMWGQFLTHDIIQTPDVGKGQVPCNCSPHASCKNIDLKNDPELTFRCMFVIRSSSKLIPGKDGIGQREQVNQQSAFVDGSVVYGFTKKHKDTLTAADGMHLLMQNNKKFDSFLPNVNQFGREINQNFQTADVFNNKKHPEFVAGDTRVLENPILSSFHTMFARLHNKAADEFAKLNSEWKASRVFEEARLFVMSVIKQINYDEHLKVVLGPKAHDSLPAIQVTKSTRKRPRVTRFAKAIDPTQGQRNTGIHVAPPNDNPSIRQEFVTAAYRFGHAQIMEKFKMANSNLGETASADVKDNYFDPHMLFQHGPGGCLRGAMTTATNTVSGKYADSTTNNLFKPSNFRHGVDLLSINLARGREHGVGSYTAVRDFCMNHPNFGKLFSGIPEMMDGWNNVKNLYENEKDVDLYVGLLMEKHLAGGQVGPTAGCIIAEQFIALKKGDRFWIENHGILSNSQLEEVKSTTLSKVMCNVLEKTTKVTKNAFLNVNVNFAGTSNDVVTCDSLGDIDFSHWRVAPTAAPTTPPPATTADPTDPTAEPIRPSAEPVDGPNSPGDEVNHAEVGCRFADRRMKLVICGGKDQPWGNDELESLLDWMKRKNGFPRKGKRTVLMNQPVNTVLRVSFAGNNGITDLSLLKQVLAFLHNVIELDLSDTGVNEEITPDFFSANKKLGNLNLRGTSMSCWSSDLVELLQSQMKSSMKLFKHQIAFASGIATP